MQKAFLKNFAYSQENSCFGFCFLWICEFLKNTYFEEHLQSDVSASIF